MSLRDDYDPGPRSQNGIKDKILILILATLVGAGGSVAYRQISPPAPDRFTGAQGQALATRIDKLYVEIDRRMDDSELSYQSHEERISALESTIERHLSKLDQIITGIHGIEVQIARLPPDEWRERIRSLEQQMLELKKTSR